jgi:hypothetical protein
MQTEILNNIRLALYNTLVMMKQFNRCNKNPNLVRRVKKKNGINNFSFFFWI